MQKQIQFPDFLSQRNISFIRSITTAFGALEQRRIEIQYVRTLRGLTKRLAPYKKPYHVKTTNQWLRKTYGQKAKLLKQQELTTFLKHKAYKATVEQLKTTYRADIVTALLRTYNNFQSTVKAVKYVEDFNNKYADFKFYGHSDSDITKLSKEAAEHCADLARTHQKDLDYSAQRMHKYADSLHIKRATTKNGGVIVILNKYTDPDFWRPRLRRIIRRRREELAFDCDLINPNFSKYSSRLTQEERKQQLDRNQKWAEKSVISNGETTIKMSDLVASKEKCYQAELTAMLKGLTDIQDQNDWHAAMLTVTCPSRMHKFAYDPKAGKFYKNKKFDGTLPKKSADHIRTVYAQSRSQAKREGLDFRMCQVWQPHSDACFHQHQFIVADKRTIKRFYEIVNQKALKIDGDEAGAKKRRTDIAWENKDKGRLSSYAARYVTRYANKDGKSCATDTATPEDAAYAAHGVRRVGWAGTPPKYLWNLFRTITKDCCNKTMRKLRKAARSGEYANFCEILEWTGNKKEAFERLGIEIIKDRYKTKHGETLKKRFAITFMNVTIFDKTKGEKWFIEPARTVTHNYPRGLLAALNNNFKVLLKRLESEKKQLERENPIPRPS